jgi:predicted dehydrogenase
MKKIKWGILGTGNIANSFARDFIYVQNGVIHAVASRSIQKSKEFADRHGIITAYGSYEDLFRDTEITVIYIATPHHLHLKNASEAMKNGKAVLCEKPITINTNEFHQLIDVAKSTGMYLMEAMWTYFLPPILKAKSWVDEGKIGNPVYVKADFGFKADEEKNLRLFDPAMAGGALLDIGIYPIALACLFYNQLPKNISVISNKTNTGVDSSETIFMEYLHGGFANLSASFLYDMPNEALLIGDEGYIRIPDFFMAKKCFLYKDNIQVDHFSEKSKCVGYNYEIEAVNHDLRASKRQSDIMPWSSSLMLQEIMDIVKTKF